LQGIEFFYEVSPSFGILFCRERFFKVAVIGLKDKYEELQTEANELRTVVDSLRVDLNSLQSATGSLEDEANSPLTGTAFPRT
jgi:hypothetical protein